MALGTYRAKLAKGHKPRPCNGGDMSTGLPATPAGPPLATRKRLEWQGRARRRPWWAIWNRKEKKDKKK